MIQHLFKLIWNKKKQNFLMMSEIFVSFFVIFAVFTLLVYFYKNYASPIGIDYEKVWVANVNLADESESDSSRPSHQAIRNMLLSMGPVQDVTFTGHNLPFAMSNNNNDIKYKQNSIVANNYVTDDHYLDVLGIKVLQGRWFNKTDDAATYRPVVINQQLQQKMFGKQNPIGEMVKIGSTDARVIGVINDVKYSGDYQQAETGYYQRMDTTEEKYHNQVLLQVKPGAPAEFEANLYKKLSATLKNASIEIEHLDNKLDTRNKLTLVPLIIAIIIAGFLIINVALGLFGVLWYNINKRKAEIGLRRAVGASAQSISAQLVGEALVIATLALLIGLFFAVQFPLLNVFDLSAGIYSVAIMLSILFIYLLVTLCAIYPGRQAAAIYPAKALHED